MIVKLVNDVLHPKRMVREGCFAGNPATDELERLGAQGLNAVEAKLIGDIANSTSEDIMALGVKSKFSGIYDLLRYYLRVGMVADPAHVTSVISTFPPALLCAALDVSCLAFREVKGVSPRIEIPDEFKKLVKLLNSAENEYVRASAQRALSNLIEQDDSPLE